MLAHLDIACTSEITRLRYVRRTAVSAKRSANMSKEPTSRYTHESDDIQSLVRLAGLAAHATDGWQPVLAKLRQRVGGTGAAFAIADLVTGTFLHAELEGFAATGDSIWARYNDELARSDRHAAFLRDVRHLSIYTDADIRSVDSGAMKTVGAWLSARLGVAHQVSCLVRSGQLGASFQIHRPATDGPFGPAEADVLDRQIAAIADTVMMYLRQLEETRLAYMAGLLGQNDASLTVVDAHGRPLFAHASVVGAQASMAESLGLRFGDGRKARMFERSLALASRGMRSPPIISEQTDGQITLVHVKPIRDRRISVLFNLARAVVFVREYRTQDKHIVMSLREVFGLTQQESRVAVLSGSGMNAREIAHEMGISYETVRSHLKAVFAKMGVNRQAEVSLIIARIDGE